MIGNITLSGILIDSTSKAITGAKVVLKSVKTGDVISGIAGSFVTGVDGSYSVTVPYGTYKVYIEIEGEQTAMPGFFNVYDYSVNGSLQDFLYQPCEEDNIPMFLFELEILRQKVKSMADSANSDAERAEDAAEKAEAVISGKGPYDSEAEGLANTVNGDLFSYVAKDGDDSYFIYAKNVNGSAVEISRTISGTAFKELKKKLSDAVTSLKVGLDVMGVGLDSLKETPRDISTLKMNNLYSLEIIGQSLPIIDEISSGLSSVNNVIDLQKKQIQKLYVANQVLTVALNELKDTPDDIKKAMLNANYSIQTLAASLLPIDDLSSITRDFEALKLQELYNLQILANALNPLDGFNPENSGGSGDAGTPLKYPGVYAYGAPRGLIRIDLSTYNGLPSLKDEPSRKGEIKFDIDGEVMKCFVLISVQGATSAAYPKKNLSLEFYPDNTFSETISLKIGDMLPHDELVFKANWIDSTHVRNTMSYNLWDKVEETRKGWPKRDIDNTYVGTVGADAVDDGATGHPTGYACIMYVDGSFYGIGDFMCGKKRKNYRIAKNNSTQILLGFDGAVNIPALPADGTYEVKAPSKPNTQTEDALNLWRSFAQSSQEDFTANRDIHLDKNNIVDFYVFLCFICAPDCTQKNTQFLTWDGVKWYFMPYDLDTTYGLHYAGTSIAYPPTLNLFDNGLVMSVNRTFWKKVLNAYRTEINARYKELRDLGVFSVDMVYNLARDLQSKYTAEMFSAEYAKWPNVPSLQITSLDQILNWTNERIEYLDSFFSYTE